MYGATVKSCPRVEAGNNTSTTALRVVERHEKELRLGHLVTGEGGGIYMDMVLSVSP
jgi:hypothetical protein